MPGRKPRTAGEVIRSYGFWRLDQLERGGRRLTGNPIVNDMLTFFPSATPAVIKEVIQQYQQAKKAAGMASRNKHGVQEAHIPITPGKGKKYTYTVRVNVDLAGSGRTETWMVPIESSKQLTEEQVLAAFNEQLVVYKSKALGRSKEKVESAQNAESVDLLFVTRRR